jgi:hypothetical protein
MIYENQSQTLKSCISMTSVVGYRCDVSVDLLSAIDIRTFPKQMSECVPALYHLFFPAYDNSPFSASSAERKSRQIVMMSPNNTLWAKSSNTMPAKKLIWFDCSTRIEGRFIILEVVYDGTRVWDIERIRVFVKWIDN